MQITPPETVQDFQDLVQWLADEFHEGTVSAIAGRLGVSVATPAFWRRGRTSWPRGGPERRRDE